MELNYHIIGTRIRTYRRRRNISQQELAELIGKSPTYISRLESGARGTKTETLVAIANALRISTDALLADHLWHHGQLVVKEYVEILSDCSDLECRILTDNTRALKQTLRERGITFAKKSPKVYPGHDKK